MAALGLFVPVSALGLERFPPASFGGACVSPLFLLSADGTLDDDDSSTTGSEDSCGAGIGLLGAAVFIGGGGAFSTSGLICVRGTMTKSWLKKSVAPIRFAMGSFSRDG